MSFDLPPFAIKRTPLFPFLAPLFFVALRRTTGDFGECIGDEGAGADRGSAERELDGGRGLS